VGVVGTEVIMGAVIIMGAVVIIWALWALMGDIGIDRRPRIINVILIRELWNGVRFRHLLGNNNNIRRPLRTYICII
jgi:hypothetical protein